MIIHLRNEDKYSLPTKRIPLSFSFIKIRLSVDIVKLIYWTLKILLFNKGSIYVYGLGVTF